MMKGPVSASQGHRECSIELLSDDTDSMPDLESLSEFSVAMAIADVFSKNGYTVSNKNAKILKIFERLKMLKSPWVISRC